MGAKGRDEAKVGGGGTGADVERRRPLSRRAIRRSSGSRNRIFRLFHFGKGKRKAKGGFDRHQRRDFVGQRQSRKDQSQESRNDEGQISQSQGSPRDRRHVQGRRRGRSSEEDGGRG